MKHLKPTLFVKLTMLLGIVISLAFQHDPPAIPTPEISPKDVAIKLAAFDVLNAKCNVCHRKQNPFKVFSLKNMEKHAKKIHQQVFIKQRMPKGDKIILTDVERQILKKWLSTQNL